jgi:hypothetical protein
LRIKDRPEGIELIGAHTLSEAMQLALNQQSMVDSRQ